MPTQKTNKKLRRSNLKDYELPGDGKVFSYLGPRPRAPGPKTGQVFSTVQTVITPNWAVTNVAVATFFSIQFTIADLDQASSFLAVFDQYRIDQIEVSIVNQGSNLNITNTGEYVTVIDYDDAAALTTLAQANDYANAVVSSGQSCQYRRFVPHIATAVYNGAFTGFKNDRADWIDAASTSVQHYGLKAAFGATSSAMSYDICVRYHVSWRAVR